MNQNQKFIYYALLSFKISKLSWSPVIIGVCISKTWYIQFKVD